MWTCPKCGERLDDGFDACWNCGTTPGGESDPGFEPEDVPVGATGRDVDCLRCGRALDFMGVKYFHEGTRWGLLGDLAELLVRKQGLELYVCDGCGHVELFTAGDHHQ